MSWASRIIGLLLGLCALAVGGLLTLAFAGGRELHFLWGPVDLGLSPAHVTQPTGWLAAGVALALLGAGLLAASLAFRPRSRFYVLSDGTHAAYGSSTVRLSRRAADALVSRAARGVDGVDQCAGRVQLTRRGWRAHLDLALKAGAPVAAVADAAEAAVRDALGHATALPVDRVRVETTFAMLKRPSRVEA